MQLHFMLQEHFQHFSLGKFLAIKQSIPTFDVCLSPKTCDLSLGHNGERLTSVHVLTLENILAASLQNVECEKNLEFRPSKGLIAISAHLGDNLCIQLPLNFESICSWIQC